MELWRHGAGGLARMIAGGEASSREVVDSNLERIEAVNGHLNALTVVLADEARAAADAGAIPIGRTNLPDLGLRIHTDCSLPGLTRNPWHPGVTAGGSSGGEGADGRGGRDGPYGGRRAAVH